MLPTQINNLLRHPPLRLHPCALLFAREHLVGFFLPETFTLEVVVPLLRWWGGIVVLHCHTKEITIVVLLCGVSLLLLRWMRRLLRMRRRTLLPRRWSLPVMLPPPPTSPTTPGILHPVDPFHRWLNSRTPLDRWYILTGHNPTVLPGVSPTNRGMPGRRLAVHILHLPGGIPEFAVVAAVDDLLFACYEHVLTRQLHGLFAFSWLGADALLWLGGRVDNHHVLPLLLRYWGNRLTRHNSNRSIIPLRRNRLIPILRRPALCRPSRRRRIPILRPVVGHQFHLLLLWRLRFNRHRLPNSRPLPCTRRRLPLPISLLLLLLLLG